MSAKQAMMADRTTTPPAAELRASRLPISLTSLRQWVGWRWFFEPSREKWTKVPVCVHDGSNASSTDPRTWATASEAANSVMKLGLNGIGFVFTAGDEFFGVDLDSCRHPVTGKVADDVRDLLAKFNSYAEVSPSLTGIKLIGRGKLPPGGRRKGDVEVYECGRYFALTGWRLKGLPTEPVACQAVLTEWHRTTFAPVPATRSPANRRPLLDDDRELIDRAELAANGQKFRQLFRHGDTAGHGNDDSVADLALCGLLAFWTGPDADRIDRLFRQSGLFRPKWDQRHSGDGRTYGQMTVAKSLAGRTDFFGDRRLVVSAPVTLAPEAPIDAGVIVVGRGDDAKALDGLALPGLTVATLPPGSISDADLSALAGRNVWLWPAADDIDSRTGRRADVDRFRDAAECLGQLAPRPAVRWIEPDDLGLSGGQGAAAFVATFDVAKRTDAVDVVLGKAQSIGALAEFDKLGEEIAAGRYRQVHFPFTNLTRLTQALLPGTVTLLCGPPGDGKSFFLLECVLHWLDEGVSTALWELEEDGAFWVRRALSLLEARPEVTRVEWEAEHSAEMKSARVRHLAALKQLDAALTTAPRVPPAPRQVADWLRRHAANGSRVLCVDPVTAVMPTDMQHLQDFRLMMDAKLIAREYRCSIVFVTHPRIGVQKGAPSLERLAGGAAFPRFAQTVLWMQKHWPPREANVSRSVNTVWSKFNRTLTIAKARNAAGGGMDLAFDMGLMRFTELGPVVSGAKPEAVE